MFPEANLPLPLIPGTACCLIFSLGQNHTVPGHKQANQALTVLTVVSQVGIWYSANRAMEGAAVGADVEDTFFEVAKPSALKPLWLASGPKLQQLHALLSAQICSSYAGWSVNLTEM